MKRLLNNIIFILVISCVITITGCREITERYLPQISSTQPEPSATETIPAKTPEPTIVSTPMDISSPSPELVLTNSKEEARFSVDLDGNGTDETITLSSSDGEYDFDEIRLRVTTKTTENEIIVYEEGWFNSAYLTETRSGQPCVLIGCDTEDELADIIVCSFDGILPVLSSTTYGRIKNVRGTDVTISAFSDFIGEWYYTCEYDLTDDFTLMRVSEYKIDRGSMEPLHTIRELPVEILAEGEYTAETLPADTLVYPVSDDGNGHFTFRLEDGSTGRITYSREDYPNRIDGLPEDEYFDNLLYWG